MNFEYQIPFQCCIINGGSVKHSDLIINAGISMYWDFKQIFFSEKEESSLSIFESALIPGLPDVIIDVALHLYLCFTHLHVPEYE